MSQPCAPQITQLTVLQSMQAENAKLRKFVAAQKTVIHSLERRAGRSLTAMGVHLQSLDAAPSDSPDWRASLDSVQHEIHSLCDLLADTMLLQKLEAGKVEVQVEPLDLRVLLLAIARPWLVAQADRPVRLMCNIAMHLPEVLADRDLTEAALMDLLSRGLKYSEAAVVLDVEAQRQRIVLRITAQRFAPLGDRSFATEIVLCCRRIEVQGGAIACEPHPDGCQTVVIELPVV